MAKAARAELCGAAASPVRGKLCMLKSKVKEPRKRFFFRGCPWLALGLSGVSVHSAS